MNTYRDVISADMRPEDWEPDWLRVAQYGRTRIVLHGWTEFPGEYGICYDGKCVEIPEGCLVDDSYKTLAEAEAAFEAACERLREGTR